MIEEKQNINPENPENENTTDVSKISDKENNKQQVKVESQSETHLELNVTEQTQIVTTENPPLAPYKSKRPALSKLAVVLSDEELTNSGVMKLIIDDLGRLEMENSVLKETEIKFYEADKNCCILDEKLKAQNAFDFFVNSIRTIGGIIVGYAFHLIEKELLTEGIISILLGLCLILFPIIYKMKMK